MKLEGKRAIVTGAGRNVGRAVCELLAAEGAAIASVDIDGASAQQTLDGLVGPAAASGVAVACDVADEGGVRDMVAEVVEALGGVDILINCVAITDRGATILDLPRERWDAVLSTSLTSAFLCTQHVARRMVDQGTGGSIINIGSTSGHKARRDVVAYGPAKAGLYNLTMSCASQLGAHGIRVNVVTPNKVGSPVGQAEEPADRSRANLLGRGGEPQDVAKAVLFMVSEDASFTTASELLVDGGFLHGAG